MVSKLQSDLVGQVLRVAHFDLNQEARCHHGDSTESGIVEQEKWWVLLGPHHESLLSVVLHSWSSIHCFFRVHRRLGIQWCMMMPWPVDDDNNSILSIVCCELREEVHTRRNGYNVSIFCESFLLSVFSIISLTRLEPTNKIYSRTKPLKRNNEDTGRRFPFPIRDRNVPVFCSLLSWLVTHAMVPTDFSFNSWSYYLRQEQRDYYHDGNGPMLDSFLEGPRG